MANREKLRSLLYNELLTTVEDLIAKNDALENQPRTDRVKIKMKSLQMIRPWSKFLMLFKKIDITISIPFGPKTFKCFFKSCETRY